MVQIAMRRGNLHLTHKHPRDGEVRGKISARKEAPTQDGNPSGLTFREAYLWDVWENYGSRLLVCEFRQAERKFHCFVNSEHSLYQIALACKAIKQAGGELINPIFAEALLKKASEKEWEFLKSGVGTDEELRRVFTAGIVTRLVYAAMTM